MNTSNWTGRCPRTLTEALGCTGHAIEVYRTPPIRRFFTPAFATAGWSSPSCWPCLSSPAVTKSTHRNAPQQACAMP